MKRDKNNHMDFSNIEGTAAFEFLSQLTFIQEIMENKDFSLSQKKDAIISVLKAAKQTPFVRKALYIVSSSKTEANIQYFIYNTILSAQGLSTIK